MHTIMVVAIFFILSLVVGTCVIIQRRLAAFKTAKLLLESLRGENGFQQIPVMVRVWILAEACDDAHVTLKDLGISMGELNEICTRRIREEESRAAWNKNK